MHRVKDGHLSELSVLFGRYHVKLYNFFLRLTFDPVISEDLTQNLFYRIIRYRHTFDASAGNFRSWIYRIARNTHLDHCRELRSSPQPLRQDEELHYPAIGAHEGYAEDDFEKLDRALGLLEPDQREIIVLSRYQGLKYEEIARLHDLSVAAVKVRIHRAIHQLRKLYFKQQ
jgi:RNA polymerase sigma-70 factor (ECF subfamily)